MKFFLALTLLLTSGLSFAQLNMQQLGNIDYLDLHNANLNDIWGYVDETGKEYALVGTTKGTSVVDISNPQNPIEVFWEPGLESIWRDLKTWGDYAYVTTEAHNGLLIIDLSGLPSSTALNTTYYFGDGVDSLKSAHNLYIDENGFCYIFGSNIGNGGVQILDVHTDPLNPTIVAEFDNWYVHDGVVRNDTMYLAHIYEGFFSLVDISDMQAPIILGTKTTPSNFAHNIWPSDNGQFVYTTDEVSGAFIGAYDITNPSNIIEVDRVQSSPGANVIPHNTHVKDNFLVTSYYSDGIVVHDATYSYNLVEVANFDTYPTQTTGYDGCWGAYPYLPSGNVLATDRETGLFILGIDYVQAAYLEGIVTDVVTSNPLSNVNVSIAGIQSLNATNLNGFYATGAPDGETVQVTYSKVGYYTEVDNVTLQNGLITVHDVELIPIPPYNLEVIVIDATTSSPISDVFVRIENEFLTHNGITNGIGEENLTLYYEGEYLVTIGKWGYWTYCDNLEIDNATGTITIELETGYYDDFSFNFGWVTSTTASQGAWERGIPFGTEENANPNRDAPWDCGKYAFVTGNAPVYSFNYDEVDNGVVKLFSPIMDLTTFSDPHVNYWLWFYDKYGPEFPDDTLRVFMSNGTETVEIDNLGYRDFTDAWEFSSIRVSDFLDVTNAMQIRVETSDFEPNDNVVDAGFDHFSVTNFNTTSIDNALATKLKVYPNPFSSIINVSNAPIGSQYRIIDLRGKVVLEEMITTENYVIETDFLNSGMYVLCIENDFIRIVKN